MAPAAPAARVVIRRVCLFAGSSRGAKAEYAAAATALGRLLAARGIGLVFGGGSIGLMGIAADAALAAGGEVIGVIPRALATAEIAHRGLSELRIVASMHERKATMASLAGAFIALPGGFGTLEELFEVITWTQLSLHAKPVGLLDVAGYFGPLRAFLAHMVAERFVRPEHRALVIEGDAPEALLETLVAWRPPAQIGKFITADET